MRYQLQSLNFLPGFQRIYADLDGGRKDYAKLSVKILS